MLRTPRLTSVLFSVAFCSAGAAPFLGCLSPTQLILELRTDVPCASTRGVSITFGAPDTLESAPPGTTTTACSGDGYIGTIAVTPAGSKSGRIAIRAVLGLDIPVEQCTAASNYQGCVVVRRELRFVPNTTSVVPIGFYRACQNVICASGFTCNADKQCVSSSGEPSTQDGGSKSYACAETKDCPSLATTPANCAEAVCDGKVCRYVAKDGDGDNDPASNCESTVTDIRVKVGTDCDDADPLIHGSTARKCTAVDMCGVGVQTCLAADPRKVGPCEGITGTTVFDCSSDSSDSDCNGILDIDELVKLQSPDAGNVCANIFRCQKGTVLPERTPLCRTGNGSYSLDCSVAGAVVIGFVPTLPQTGLPQNTTFLAADVAKTRVFPTDVASGCNPGTTKIGFCNMSGAVCAITSVPVK